MVDGDQTSLIIAHSKVCYVFIFIVELARIVKLAINNINILLRNSKWHLN